MEANQFREEIIRGEEHLQQGKTDQAFEIFESLLQKEPDNVVVLNDKGVTLNRLGRYEEAIQLFLVALQKDKNNSNAAFNLIANYITIGKWEEVQSVLDKFRHCLTENDTKMITDDLRKFRSDVSSMADTTGQTIVTFSIRSNADQYDMKLSLDLNQFSQKIMWDYLSNGKLYEPETSQLVERVLKEEDCFVDIGAHIGYFSLLAAKIVGDHGTVFSFEPEKKNYDHLKQNIAMNDLTNIKTFNIALSSDDKEGELFVNSDNDGGHALWDVSKHPFNKNSRHAHVKQAVTIATLDSIIQSESIDRIHLIKIDTEGTEHNILQGSLNTIKRCKVPYIICEINRFGLKQMGTSETRLREFMKELGYETYLIRQEEPKLLRLSPGDQVETTYVFNVLFIKVENIL
jgi:FkbM family methyltransferase